MKCIVIDDETLAQEILMNYIERTPALRLVGVFSNSFEALTFLKNNPVELIFLDIQMPVLSGIDFLKTLYPRPLIIITSAYPQYALESYHFEVVDYLLKPFSYERFEQALAKIDRFKQKLLDKSFEQSSSEYLFVKVERRLVKINLDDILFVEGFGNYVKIYTPREVVVTREKMGDVEKYLPASTFVRVHKSYIVSLRHIDSIEQETIYAGKYFIPIGNSYKAEFFSRLQQSE